MTLDPGDVRAVPLLGGPATLGDHRRSGVKADDALEQLGQSHGEDTGTAPDVHASQPRLPRRPRGAQANQAHLPRGVIAKTFLLRKTFRAHGTNFLRQEKSIRDHGYAAGPTDVIRRRASALMPHQSP